MAKKLKFQLQQSEELESVDLELDAALSTIDEVNARVSELLETHKPAPEEAPAGAAESHASEQACPPESPLVEDEPASQ